MQRKIPENSRRRLLRGRWALTEIQIPVVTLIIIIMKVIISNVVADVVKKWELLGAPNIIAGVSNT